MCKTQVFLSACVQEAWGLQTAYWDAAIQTSPPEAKRAAETFLWTWTRVSPKHAGGLGKARSPTEAETELAGVWKGGAVGSSAVPRWSSAAVRTQLRRTRVLW